MTPKTLIIAAISTFLAVVIGAIVVFAGSIHVQNAVISALNAKPLRIGFERGASRENIDRFKSYTSIEVLHAVDLIESIVSGDAVVSVSGVQKVAEEAQNGVYSVDFAVNAQGEYADVDVVLNKLNNLPFPSRIMRFDLKQSGGSGQSSTWALSASIRFFTTAKIPS